MAETIYPKGIRTFKKNDKQPDFVLGSVIISLNEFIEWCKDNPTLLTEYEGKKQLKLQCVTKKEGGVTFTVDTFKPAKTEPQQSATPFTDAVNSDDELNDMPF